MEREKIESRSVARTVDIEETKIKSFNKESSEEHSFRVYDGEFAGIQYIQGKCADEEGFAKAEENLALKRPYGYKQETGSRHRDKTEAEYSDKELMELAREAIEYLRTHHPDFSFKGYVMSDKTASIMSNSLGLDYSNTDCTTSINLQFKHKESKNITDGCFGIGQRTFDFGKFTDMADNYLTNFTNTAPLPEELIIQDQYYDYLRKFYDSLNAENIALGTSLFADKMGSKVFADSFTLLHDASDEECWYTPFFDGEGVVNPEDKFVFIENGVLLTGYSDKRTAEKYGVKHTGSGSFSFRDIPQPGSVNFRIRRSDNTVKELLDGRLTVVPVWAGGGGFNDKGEYVTPVQTAMLCDGERFIGRLPEFTMKGSLFNMFGKDFIGVGSDNPVFNDKQILMRMEYGK